MSLRLRPSILSLTLPVFLAAATVAAPPSLAGSAGSQDAKPPAEATAAVVAPATPEARLFVTKHQIRIGGAVLAYTATAGTMPIRNDKDEVIALFGFTAYVKDGGDPRTRPIMFAYNGGPGSASAWLHMGILGPRRTVLKDLDANTTGPFRTVDNEFTILDRADLVMIDPVGTGFSRPVGKGEGKDFWGVDQDVRSVSDFIVRYLNRHGRWAAPKFILGESYGGMRTAGVSYELLTKHNVALNGVILTSPYLDFASGNAGLNLHAGDVNFLPTYAATAWYHNALANRPADLQPFLREVEAFAQDVYAPVLFKGSRATAAERRTVLAGLARYTGLSTDYWDKANLRTDEAHFLQELLRDKGLVVGRVDTRYLGGTLNALSETTPYDPYGSSIAPAIVATFNDYYRQELKVESDRRYVLSGDLWKDWDDRHAQPGSGRVPFANTVVDLAHAMTLNPKMKVLVQTGYFDLACPYRTAEYAIEHLAVAPVVRSNVTIAYYDAGHMMYVHPPSMQKFKDDVAAFVDANAR
jgi:carboxypeptidase C (cathepsin A)